MLWHVTMTLIYFSDLTKKITIRKPPPLCFQNMIPVHITVLELFLFFLKEKVTVETPVRKIMTALDISRSKHFRTKTIPKIVNNCNVA